MDVTPSLTEMDWLSRLRPTSTSPQDQKPPYSYANLITRALNSVPGTEKKMTVVDILKWVEETFPYYRGGGSAWKTSIRHTLTTNKSFIKVARLPTEPGNGSFWTFDSSIDQNEILTQSFDKNQPRKRSTKQKQVLPEFTSDSSDTSRPHSLTSSGSSTFAKRLLDPGNSFTASFSLANFPGLDDFSASFKQFCQQVTGPTSSSTSTTPPPTSSSTIPSFTLDAVESLMTSLKADHNLLSSLDPTKFQLAQSLLLSVRKDVNLGDWTTSSHFPALAQSINDLLGGASFTGGHIPAVTPPSVTTTTAAHVAPEEEDNFDWNTIL